jgi:hypothetical protein
MVAIFGCHKDNPPYFFLVIISFRCLPLSELGKCIFETVFVEEDICNEA